MTCDVLLDVLPSGEILMKETESLGQGVGEFGYGNVMDVVGHQSLACQLKMRKAKVFAQQ